MPSAECAGGDALDLLTIGVGVGGGIWFQRRVHNVCVVRTCVPAFAMSGGGCVRVSVFVRLFARTLALLAADETTTTAQASQGITAAYRIYDKEGNYCHIAR